MNDVTLLENCVTLYAITRHTFTPEEFHYKHKQQDMKKLLILAIIASFVTLTSCEVEVRDGHHYHHPMGWEHSHHPDHHETYDHGYHHDHNGLEIEVHH